MICVLVRMVDWKCRCLLYEEYMATELGIKLEDVRKWLKETHPDEALEDKPDE